MKWKANCLKTNHIIVSCHIFILKQIWDIINNRVVTLEDALKQIIKTGKVSWYIFKKFEIICDLILK